MSKVLVNAVTGKVGVSTRSGFSDVLLNHKSGAFVLAQPGKLRMPQPICSVHSKNSICATASGPARNGTCLQAQEPESRRRKG